MYGSPPGSIGLNAHVLWNTVHAARLQSDRLVEAQASSLLDHVLFFQNSDQHLDVMITTEIFALIFVIDFELAVVTHGRVAEVCGLNRLEVPILLRKLSHI